MMAFGSSEAPGLIDPSLLFSMSTASGEDDQPMEANNRKLLFDYLDANNYDAFLPPLTLEMGRVAIAYYGASQSHCCVCAACDEVHD